MREKASLCGVELVSPARRYKVDKKTVCLDDFGCLHSQLRKIQHIIIIRVLQFSGSKTKWAVVNE